MLESSLCDYSDAYMLVKRRITITRDSGPPEWRTVAQLLAVPKADERNKKLIFKDCVPFTNCIKETNNTQADNAKDIDVETLMYNLI